jgi:hypothetical protein
MLYSVLFITCVTLLLADKHLRPRGRDLFFLHNPVYSVGCMFIVVMLLGAAHEGAHWLAARVQGIPAQITISRRLYFLVLQTDLTGIWTLPRRKRYGPILAGMAFDTVRLAALLAARITASAGMWHPSSTLARLIVALVAQAVVAIMFQFFVFLRTDIYALISTCLGCMNLTRTTQLLLRRQVLTLTARDQDELDHASARDLEVARWYRWLYVVGLVAATWFFFSFFGPNIVTIAEWTASQLDRTSPSHVQFWTELMLGCLALAPIPLTIFVIVRERIQNVRRGRAAPAVRRPMI